MPDKTSSPELRSLIAPALFILVTSIRALANRFNVTPDGLNYLDMAEAFRSGNLNLAINAYWSPLYGALLAIAQMMVHTSRGNEPFLVQAVNYLILICAAIAFSAFLREFERLRQRANAGSQVPSSFPWLLFTWIVLKSDLVGLVTPDLLVTTLFLAAMRQVCRIARDAATARSAVALGIWLGLGFLSKAAMLPVGVITLAMTIWITRPQTRLQLASLASFVLITVPLIVALSIEKGRFTYSETPRYNLLWDVERLPPYFPPANIDLQRLKHPPRLLHSTPRVYQFVSSEPISFPLYYDPSYWYDGAPIQYDYRKTAINLVRSAYHLVHLFWAPFLGLAVLLYFDQRALRRGGWLVPVLLPAVVGTTIYFPFHIEPRYLAAFAAVGLVACFSALTVQRRLNVVFTILSLWLAGIVVTATIGDVQHLLGQSRTPRADVYREITAELRKIGVQKNETVGALTYFGYWPRYASVQASIVGERHEFFRATPAQRVCALSAMSAAGARAVVSRDLPPIAFREGWTRVGNSWAALHPLQGMRCVLGTFSGNN